MQTPKWKHPMIPLNPTHISFKSKQKKVTRGSKKKNMSEYQRTCLKRHSYKKVQVSRVSVINGTGIIKGNLREYQGISVIGTNIKMYRHTNYDVSKGTGIKIYGYQKEQVQNVQV